MRRYEEPLPEPELSVFRSATVWMLRRYFNVSMEFGRLPSWIGREVFRSRVHRHHASFESFVIYILDIERCILRLRRDDQEMIKRVVLQEYTQEEAARLMNWPVIRIERRLPEVLDYLTEQFIRLKLMKVPTLPLEPSQDAVGSEVSSAENSTLVDRLLACDSQVGPSDISQRHTRESDWNVDVPVEIFLSSPLDVTNPCNSYVQ